MSFSTVTTAEGEYLYRTSMDKAPSVADIIPPHAMVCMKYQRDDGCIWGTSFVRAWFDYEDMQIGALCKGPPTTRFSFGYLFDGLFIEMAPSPA